MHLHNGSLHKESDFCFLEVLILCPSFERDKDNWKKSKYIALIDTGCNRTSISHEVASRLNLTTISSISMKTASGDITERSIVDASLIIPSSAPDPILFPSQFDIRPVVFPKHGHHDVLLGMDILRKCYFTIGNEEFTLST